MKPHNWGTAELALPRFDDSPTKELQSFLKSFFVLKLPRTFYNQHIACTVVLGFLHVCGGLIIIRGIRSGKWWVFRNQRTTSNSKLYLIPNATSCYILIEGAYFWCWIAYTYYSRCVDMEVVGGSSRGYFILLVWFPCWLASWAGAVGTLYVSPGSTLRNTKDDQSIKNFFVPSPSLVNWIALGFPVVILAGVLMPSVLGGIEYSSAWHLWHNFDATLAMQDPEFTISTQQSEVALKIWTMFSEAYFYFSIGFFVQVVGAIALALSYGCVAINLSLILRSQIKESEILFGSFRVPVTIEEAERRVSVWNSVRTKRGEVAATEEETRAVQSRFYPSVRGATAQIAAADSPEQRSKVLKEALSTVVTLSVCINCGILIFIAWLLYVTTRCYEDSLKGPRAFTGLHRSYHLVAAWNGTVVGVISFYLVLNRTYQTFFETHPSRSLTSSFMRTAEKLLPLSFRRGNSEQPTFDPVVVVIEENKARRKMWKNPS